MTGNTLEVEKTTKNGSAPVNGARPPSPLMPSIGWMISWSQLPSNRLSQLTIPSHSIPMTLIACTLITATRPGRPFSTMTCRTQTSSGKVVDCTALNIPFAPQRPRKRLNALSCG